MIHRTSPRFWQRYYLLPDDIQQLAQKQFQLLKNNPQHPSLHFKKIGRYWTARIDLHHPTIAVESGENLVWFWIGPHDQYELIIGKR